MDQQKRSGAGPSVLLVYHTSEWLVADNWQLLLQDAGYECTVVKVAEVAPGPYSLIILCGAGTDLSHARIVVEGIEGLFPSLPILVITAHAEKKNIDVFVTPRTHVLPNPVGEQTLLSKVAELLSVAV